MNLQEAFKQYHQQQSFHAQWNSIRENGARYFVKHGLPNRQDEAWKYTSLKFLKADLLEPTAAEGSFTEQELKTQLQPLVNKDFFQLVFVDGKLDQAHSDLQELKSLRVVNLAKIHETELLKTLRRGRKKVGPALRQDSMEALNSAFAGLGIGIEVPAHTGLRKPLQLVFLQKGLVPVYPKVLMSLGEGASLTLLESYFGGQKQSLTNSVSEISLSRSARLNYIRIQEQGPAAIHIGRSRIYLEESSHLEAFSYATGASVCRHNLEVHCVGEQAFAQVNGLTLGSGSQHHDNRTLIDHAVGHCTTTQHYKSILDGQSRAVFNGQVLIREDAQKASSEQLNNNLVLSAQAEADTKPELMIYADDVKASHGSTVGQLNSDELFYFLSRAIPREKALEMLSLGFVQDLIDRLSNEQVRSWLSAQLLAAYQKMKDPSS